jgi:8-oxo-dGTP pyrophosphatase MutT (NUDIX family)
LKFNIYKAVIYGLLFSNDLPIFVEYFCSRFILNMRALLRLNFFRKSKIDHTWYKRPPGVPEHVSAGGVVARVEKKHVYVALVGQRRRSKYVLPKGHVENGETLEQAARREIEEEAGFTRLKLIAPLGVKERLDFSKRHWKSTHYFLFTTRQADATPAEDRYKVKWFLLEEIPELFWPEQTQLIHENRKQIAALAE